MRVTSAAPRSPSPPSKPDFHFAPGPKGKILQALRHHSTVADVVRHSGLSTTSARYFLKKLSNMGLVNLDRSTADRRVLDMRLATEPPKPVLTPALMPLVDPTDWRTWMERLLLEKMGGPVVLTEEPTEVDASPNTGVIAVARKRVIIAGTKPGWEHLLKQKYAARVRLTFHNDINGASSTLRQTLKNTDFVIINKRKSRHAVDWTVKDSGVPFQIISGAYTNICKTLEEFLGQETAVRQRAG